MAGHGMDSEALAAFRQSFPQPLDRSLVVGRAILERRIVHVQNVAADTALLQVVRDLGGTAIVAIPLLRDGGPIGAIALNGRQPGGFSESQIALLQTFAEQAAIAISSAKRIVHFRSARRRWPSGTASTASGSSSKPPRSTC
jgi:GAF domain-containing protein